MDRKRRDGANHRHSICITESIEDIVAGAGACLALTGPPRLPEPEQAGRPSQSMMSSRTTGRTRQHATMKRTGPELRQ